MKREFRTQVDFASVIKLSAVLGFGFGVPVSILTLFTSLYSDNIAQSILVSFAIPFFTAAGGIFNGGVGYPFYVWWCSRVKGQTLSGKFFETTTD